MTHKHFAVAVLVSALTATPAFASAITKPGYGFSYDRDDVEWYANYFMVDSLAFDSLHRVEQISASDVNADGIPLTLADYVCLIRKVTSTGRRRFKSCRCDTTGYIEASAVKSDNLGRNLHVRIESDKHVGALLLIFRYDSTEILTVAAGDRASEMDVFHRIENHELRVLLSKAEDRAGIKKPRGHILTIATTGGGSITLDSIHAVTYEGQSIGRVVVRNSNYSSPFCGSSSFSVQLEEQSAYELRIYNIAGQLVRTFRGVAGPGTVSINWDGTSESGNKLASGVYFYVVQVGDQTGKGKMLLMK